MSNTFASNSKENQLAEWMAAEWMAFVGSIKRFSPFEFIIEDDVGLYLKKLPKGVCLRNGELVYEDEWGAYLSLERAYQLGFLVKEELLTCGSEFVGVLIKDGFI